MIISRAQVDRVLRAYLERIPAERVSTPRQRPAAADAVELSDEGRRVAHYVALARSLPDVRPERVAALRDALRSGRYDVAPEAVAAKMLERLLADAAAEAIE